MLLTELSEHRKSHETIEVALQQVLHFQKADPMPPPRTIKLGKDDMVSNNCTLESWKYEEDLVKSSIDQTGDLAEGMWNACSDVIDEWGISEIEESLESLTSKNEVIEQVRAASASDIQDLAVVDSEAIHFSVISPSQMATRVNEHAKITRKGHERDCFPCYLGSSSFSFD